MSSVKRAERPSRSLLQRSLRWIKLVVATQVHLKRRGSQLHMVFEDTAYRASEAKGQAATAEPAPDAAVQQMRAALKQLLDRHGPARRVMRHLCLLESHLKRSGSQAFETLPVEALSTALLQLDSLTGERPAPGLAELRLRLSAVIAAGASVPEPKELEELAGAYEAVGSKLSDFCTSQRMQVQELTPSDFADMTKSWLGRPPAVAPAQGPKS